MEKMNVDGLVGKDTDCKDICVSVNAHQRRFTAEEAPHNQIDKITCPMIANYLFPQTVRIVCANSRGS